MKFGLFLMNEHPGRNPSEAFDEDLRLIQAADELGFEEVWIGEHHSYRWELLTNPELMIAKASALTSRIKLGPGVRILPLHHPLDVAEQAVVCDHLTHGRYLFGAGKGSFPNDFKLFGVNRDEARSMTRESMELILKAWTSEGPFSFQGRYWQVEDVDFYPKPFQRPHPPIHIACSAPETYEYAGAMGYAPMSVYLYRYAELARFWGYYEAGARAAGRTPDRAQWRIIRETYVAETTARARAEIDAGANGSYNYLGQFGTKNRLKADPNMTDDQVDAQYLMDYIPWVVGDPEECIRRMKELEAAVGGFGVYLLSPSREWVSNARWLDCLRLFAKEVIPAFAGA
jgi:limonene 1,2-monooxygenase